MELYSNNISEGEKMRETECFLFAPAGVSAVDVLLFTADLMKCCTPTHDSVHVTVCPAPFVAAKLLIFYTSWLVWPHKVPCKSSVEQTSNTPLRRWS